MAQPPDLILQFERHLALELGASVVRAYDATSRYERRTRPLIDPDANHPDEPRRMGPALWMFRLQSRGEQPHSALA